MDQLSALVQARVREVPAYRPGQTGTGSMAGKLSSNEAPLGPAPGARAALAELQSVQRYPEHGTVTARLAKHVGTCPDRLLLTNGSDELCFLLSNLFLAAGRTAVVGEPGYQIDATVSALSGADVRRIPLRDGAHDLSAMAEAAQTASVVWLPSPHNPTGVTTDPMLLEKFLAAVPADCAVVLDEAYRAFADADQRPHIPRLLQTYPNLIVQRTLSKDWALAGLRVGYALAAEPVIDALSRVRPPFSVNSAALLAADAALDHEGWQTMSITRVRQERALLQTELDQLGVAYFPSQANFVTARLEHDRLRPALIAAGLTVRPGEDLGLPGWVRISIGWSPQMALLRAALRHTISRDAVAH